MLLEASWFLAYLHSFLLLFLDKVSKKTDDGGMEA
jgi:hypothetical protein